MSPKKPKIGKAKSRRAPAKWKGVERTVRSGLKRFMRALPEAEQNALVRETMLEIREVLRGAVRKAEKAAGRLKGAELLTFDQLRRSARIACRTLSIDPPKPGEPIDHNTLRARKRVLVRAFHPDMSGTDATREQYEAVLAACDVVEQYNQSLADADAATAVDVPAAPPTPADPAVQPAVAVAVTF